MAATGLNEECSNGLYCLKSSWEPENSTLGLSLLETCCVRSRVRILFGACRGFILPVHRRIHDLGAESSFYLECYPSSSLRRGCRCRPFL